jgi:hypothetical protein
MAISISASHARASMAMFFLVFPSLTERYYLLFLGNLFQLKIAPLHPDFLHAEMAQYIIIFIVTKTFYIRKLDIFY